MPQVSSTLLQVTLSFLLSTFLPLGLSGAAGSNAGRAEEFDSVGETKGVLKSAHYTAS